MAGDGNGAVVLFGARRTTSAPVARTSCSTAVTASGSERSGHRIQRWPANRSARACWRLRAAHRPSDARARSAPRRAGPKRPERCCAWWSRGRSRCWRLRGARGSSATMACTGVASTTMSAERKRGIRGRRIADARRDGRSAVRSCAGRREVDTYDAGRAGAAPGPGSCPSTRRRRWRRGSSANGGTDGAQPLGEHHRLGPFQGCGHPRVIPVSAGPDPQDHAICAGADGGASDRGAVAGALGDGGNVDHDGQVSADLGAGDGRDLEGARAVGILAAGLQAARCSARGAPALFLPRRSRSWRPSSARAPRSSWDAAARTPADRAASRSASRCFPEPAGRARRRHRRDARRRSRRAAPPKAGRHRSVGWRARWPRWQSRVARLRCCPRAPPRWWMTAESAGKRA